MGSRLVEQPHLSSTSPQHLLFSFLGRDTVCSAIFSMLSISISHCSHGYVLYDSLHNFFACSMLGGMLLLATSSSRPLFAFGCHDQHLIIYSAYAYRRSGNISVRINNMLGF